MATDPLQNQLEQILVSIMSTDNEVRALAEKACEQIAVGAKAQYLLQTLHNNVAAEEVLQLAAVLLRRVFSLEWEDLYTNLPLDVKAQFLAQLLATGQATQQPNVSSQLRKKVGEVLAEAARNLIDDEGNNQWPEYLKFLFECASSPLPVVKESALQMFSLVPGIFGNQQANYLEVIHQMLLQALQDQANQQVRFSAVKATTSFLLAHEKDTAIHRHFSDLLPLLLQSIADSVQAQDDDTYLKCLIELAENTPRYLRFQFDPVMQLCMKVLADGNMLESWRHLALEVTVTLSETASAMMRKLGSKYLSALVVQILAMMVDLDDEPDWAISDEVAEDDNDSNSVVGESALDRLACGLGGKVILQQVTTNVPQMLNNADWKQRHAALMAVSAVGEGCHKQMEILLPQLMDGILPFLQDPHPRVRFAACNAIGQMATDFAPVFEKKFHEKVIPGLLMLLEDSAHPRVQAHAGAALVNFAEDCPKNLLVLYLERIMERLEAVLSAKFNELVEKGTKLVLEQIVTTVASVADTAEDKFTAYYDRFMPCLKYIIQNAVTPELRVLRGKTIECVSLIGLAVGAEKFLPDASAIMELLLRAQAGGEELADDDPQVSYMISAWARICKIMGKQFEQYLPLVMGPVMRAASVKPEVALVDSDDMKVIEGDDEWQFVSLGEQQNFGIRTAGLEDKATACQMLVCYARELKEGFAEYTEQVVKLMVPMLKFYFHDGVRSAASESLPCLLECAKIKGDAFIADMWNYICPELLKVMDTEPESDVLAEHLQAMGKCIEVTGRSLSEESMNELVRILDNILKDHFEKFNERQAKRTDEDYDEEVEETLLDEDDQDVEILARVSDVIHAVFTAYKETFFPRFDQLLPHFVKLLADDRPWSDHQWALCVFDDVIEHGGPACIKYQAFFLPHLIKYINSTTAEVRQAAAYGVGVMAQFAGDQFAQVCAEAIPPLVKVISEPESRGPENVSSTENAIAAVTKILKYNSSVVNVDEILPHWLSWLPVWEDDAETPHVYGYLCDLIEGNHRLVLGENDGNLPRLVAIIAEVFNKEAICKEHPVYQRLVNIIRQVQTNADVFGACLAQLNPALHQTLHNLLSTQ